MDTYCEYNIEIRGILYKLNIIGIDIANIVNILMYLLIILV